MQQGQCGEVVPRKWCRQVLATYICIMELKVHTLDATIKDSKYGRNAIHFCAVVSARESLQEILIRSAGDQV